MNTITEEDRKAIDKQIKSHPNGGDFELYVRLKEIAEWGIQYARQEVAELRKENERLRNDLLDALDLKKGNGPTALSMQAETIKHLTEALSRCSECNDLATSREYAKSALSGTKETE